MSYINNLEQLQEIYGEAGETSRVKVTSVLTTEYRQIIDASSFAVLATAGPEGLDCSPRGDAGGVVHIVDERTLLLPDRRGNNRIDSLRNVVRQPNIALLFFLPGCGNTLRINGSARICIDPSILEQLAMEGQRPRSALEIKIAEVYFQCARAILRSELWNPERFLDQSSLPSPGQILAKLSSNRVGGDEYDKAWPERAKNSMW